MSNKVNINLQCAEAAKSVTNSEVAHNYVTPCVYGTGKVYFKYCASFVLSSSTFIITAYKEDVERNLLN